MTRKELEAIEAGCPGEMDLPTRNPVLFATIKQATLAEAAAPAGAFYAQLSPQVAAAGFPCTATKIMDMAVALINLGQTAPLLSTRIGVTTAANDAQGLAAMAKEFQDAGRDRNLVGFLNLAALYLAELNAARGGGSQAQNVTAGRWRMAG